MVNGRLVGAAKVVQVELPHNPGVAQAGKVLHLPGRVYASQTFAALSIAQGITDFKCDYVGHVPLAKDYGSFPLYHLRRTGETG
jgi:hypothetical protein